MSWWTQNRKKVALLGGLALAPWALPALGGLLGVGAAGAAGAAGAGAAGATGAAGALGTGASLAGTGLAGAAETAGALGSGSSLLGTGLSTAAGSTVPAAAVPSGFMNSGLLAGAPHLGNVTAMSSAPAFMDKAMMAGKAGMKGLADAGAVMGAMGGFDKQQQPMMAPPPPQQQTMGPSFGGYRGAESLPPELAGLPPDHPKVRAYMMQRGIA